MGFECTLLNACQPFSFVADLKGPVWDQRKTVSRGTESTDLDIYFNVMQ